jgi:hypothetical protein
MNDPRILVDPEDAWLLEDYQWQVVRPETAKTDYAERCTSFSGKRKTLRLHRVIMGAPDGIDVDHKNGNGLDNRRENLRLATRSQNKANVGLTLTNTSGRKGVSWHHATKKWRAQIRTGGRHMHLGLFTDLDEAARVYDRAAIEHYGEFALTNEMLGLLRSTEPEEK